VPRTGRDGDAQPGPDRVRCRREDGGGGVAVGRNPAREPRQAPHRLQGPIESGLAKICAIGLGNTTALARSTATLHGRPRGGDPRRRREAGGHGPDPGGSPSSRTPTTRPPGSSACPRSAVRDGGEAARRGAPADGTPPARRDRRLVCDRLGKNVSGAGLDTNVIGRSVYGYTPASRGATAWRASADRGDGPLGRERRQRRRHGPRRLRAPEVHEAGRPPRHPAELPHVLLPTAAKTPVVSRRPGAILAAIRTSPSARMGRESSTCGTRWSSSTSSSPRPAVRWSSGGRGSRSSRPGAAALRRARRLQSPFA